MKNRVIFDKRGFTTLIFGDWGCTYRNPILAAAIFYRWTFEGASSLGENQGVTLDHFSPAHVGTDWISCDPLEIACMASKVANGSDLKFWRLVQKKFVHAVIQQSTLRQSGARD
jgi:hypothetical protein